MIFTKRKDNKTMLYEYLLSNYTLGEPIFASDIDIPNMTGKSALSFEKING